MPRALRPGAPPSRAPQDTAARPQESAVLRALDTALSRDGHGTPLSPREQDALRGALGTSVADVRVVRRPEVEPALRAARADGLTLGQTVFLPHDLPLTAPAGLALAAHEITHARRVRDPLFVPAALTRPASPASRPAPAAGDEEGVALATEHAVARQAAAGPARVAAASTFAGEATPRALGLPAPWEPMPTWDAPERGTPAPQGLPAGPERGGSPALSRPALPGPAPAAAPLWQAAATDRPAAAPAPAQRPPDEQAVGRRAQSGSAVDLDQVAREVYARLRERLGQELRRLS